MTRISTPRFHRILLHFETGPLYLILKVVQPCQPKGGTAILHSSGNVNAQPQSIPKFPAPSHCLGPYCLYLLLVFFLPCANHFFLRSAYAKYVAYMAGIRVRVISFSGVIIKLSRLACVSLSPRDPKHQWSAAGPTDRLTARPGHISSSITSLSMSSSMY